MSGLMITGIGTVSPAGSCAAEFWAGVCNAHISPSTLEDELVAVRHMENRRFYRSPVPRVASPSFASTGMASQFAYHAVKEALCDAGGGWRGRRVGLVVGTGAGDIDLSERECFAGVDAEAGGAYTTATALAREFGLHGPILTLSTACSASAAAFHCAEDILDAGEADAVVVCGTEAASRTTLAAFNRMYALDPDFCRPFAQDRQGTVLGDGAAAIVLQPLSERTENRQGYASLRGLGITCDAYHPTAPRPDGAMIGAAVAQALERAAITPDAVDLIVPHGTGTVANDQVEYEMLLRLFGERLSSVPVFPLKGKIGHSGGGAGAFSVLALALMLRHQLVPPSQWWRPASAFRLCIPCEAPAKVRARFGLVNAYSFGGTNASLILEANP